MKKLDKEGMLRTYQTTFAALSGEKPLSPIVGMGMVSMQQAAEYLGVGAKEVQALRQRLRKDMDALGMVIATAREIVGGIPGAVRHSDGSYDLPLEDGGMTHVTGGKYTYFSAAAVKRLAEALMHKKEVPAEGNDQVRCGAVAVFEHAQFGKVRTVQVDGEPWLVGKDVATALGYSNTKDALSTHVDPEDRKIIQRSENTTFEIPNRGITVINESGLYALVLSSKLPMAKKFRRWVTSEVLPSIRKTGGYISGQENLSDVELLAKAVLVAQKTIEERNAQIAALEAKNERDRPKVAFAEAVEQSDKSITVGAFAKILYDRDGIAMGRNTMFKWLRGQKLLDASNYPYQRYMNAGYFEVAEVIKNGQIYKVPFITGRGQVYLSKKLMENVYARQ